MLLSIKLLKLPANKDILLKLVAFLAVNMLSGYLSLWIPGWFPGLLLLALSCTLSAVFLRLLRPSDLLKILST